LSDFKKESQKKKDWIAEGDKYKREAPKNRSIFRKVFVPIFKPENMGENLAIDEKNIGDEVYTILSNKDTGKAITVIEGLKQKMLEKILSHLSQGKRFQVKTISKDLARNFDWIARTMFPNAQRIADKFHIIKLALEALQAVRTRYRQEVLKAERHRREGHKADQALLREEAKKEGRKHKTQPLSSLPPLANGDTRLELLARGRGLLFKYQSEWTVSQAERAKILFALFPEIQKVYNLIESFRGFYNRTPGEGSRDEAQKTLKEWFKKVGGSDIDEIQNFASTVDHHENEILNYFDDGHTNAFAESLNAKIQRFLINNYGIKNKDFFFFRLQNLIA
jgi:transposase